MTWSTRRELRAWLRDEGEAYEDLPWSSPADAYRWLPAAGRARVDALAASLEAAWCSPAAHLDAARAFAAVDPRSRVALYPGSPPGGPPWFAQSITTGEPTLEPLRCHEVLPEVRMYELDGDDPFADRPATIGALARRAHRRENTIPYCERILGPNDVHHQLRMVLYRRSRASLYAGWFRRRTERRFGVEEHALLLAARPALRRWSHVASAIGVAPLGDGALIATLEALDRPALLLHRGRVAFANAAGARLIGAVRSWNAGGRPAGFATSTSLEPGGLAVELVLPHDAASPQAGASGPPLPPSLARVADLVAAGLSDKDVARRLDIPLATARTYVARAMRRLGVHDRRELILGRIARRD